MRITTANFEKLNPKEALATTGKETCRSAPMNPLSIIGMASMAYPRNKQ
jgi:hypothetical protein